ncbi:MAG: single-stranded-DNA-specific exonuclease RecJ [Patescibacteria group bacterium]
MKKYVVRNDIPRDIDQALLAYPELIRKLLYYRDVTTPEAAHTFLNPNFETGVHDPYLHKDMDKAVERILRAIENNEKVLIYSDYDADGIPAAVIMHDFFKAIGFTNFEVYIPHRHTEGFGLHLEAVDKFKEQGVNLMITLDCGIVDVDEVKSANSFGIDVIITDHHEAGPELPPAYAIVNAKQKDCEYPFDYLCGSGVAFKLVQAVLKKKRFDLKEGAEKWFLDMAGLATLSDMVPLHGENRVLAYYGLKVLRKSRRPGLIKLLSIMKMNQAYITEDDVGFMITPRINAASRMGIPKDAFMLLSETDEPTAHGFAKHLDEINKERKTLVATLVKEVKKVMLEREEHFRNQRVIVLGNPAWRPAILGLAANTIAEEHNKPVFLWGREEGVHIKGSCRSDGVSDLTQIMAGARHAFIDCGGHKMSGGFSVDHEKIHHLEEALVSSFAAMNTAKLEPEPEMLDAVLTLDEVTWQLYNHIEKLAPFGMGNPKPTFLFPKVTISGVKMFGKHQEHLELSFKNSNNKIIKSIGFFMKPEDFANTPKEGKNIDLVATLEKSMFGGKTELRMRIVDLI